MQRKLTVDVILFACPAFRRLTTASGESPMLTLSRLLALAFHVSRTGERFLSGDVIDSITGWDEGQVYYAELLERAGWAHWRQRAFWLTFDDSLAIEAPQRKGGLTNAQRASRDANGRFLSQNKGKVRAVSYAVDSDGDLL